MHAPQLYLTFPCLHPLHTEQFALRLPCGHGLQTAHRRFSRPCAHGLHAPQSRLILPCAHRLADPPALCSVRPISAFTVLHAWHSYFTLPWGHPTHRAQLRRSLP